ncbi:MAG: hypothetical protein G01um1014106_84 [Parcubacteria group bacterium Gr01-1014_106]|nr:MAG: hypothetical protein G01um1014106_84 [Parcubacteria group bacterium Gr01-1014_106]
MTHVQQILSVPRAVLEERLQGIPLGFTMQPELLAAFQDTVRTAGAFGPRPALEEDPTYLQIIVQGLVTDGTSVLALFRQSRERSAERFVETRHNTKVALSAGGHVEPVEEGSQDILRSALERELHEELVFDPAPALPTLTPLGLVSTAAPDAELFHRVHIGIVYRVPLPGVVRLPEASDEFTHVELVRGSALEALLPRMEGWGQLLATAILDERLSLSVPETVATTRSA